MNIDRIAAKIAKDIEYSKEIRQHLIERGVDPDRSDIIIDKENNKATFLIYNLSGQLVGYQRYNPLGSKKNYVKDEALMKYFTWIGKDGTKGHKIACWGLESIKPSTRILYLTEGIFDANMVHKTGRACVALLSGTPDEHMMGFLRLLPFRKIGIADNDEGSSKSRFSPFETVLTPDPYKDCGEMTVNEVDAFLTRVEHGKVAKAVFASSSEKEVERFLKVFLKNTKFNGHAFGVGGYVRDELLGKEAKDLDIVVDLEHGARDLTDLIWTNFKKEVTRPVNMGNYPIWQITFKENIVFKGEEYATEGAVIEFADSMKESYADENSRQRNVTYAPIEDDVKRRDFTVNMMMKDMSTGEFVDLTGVSKSDIEKGILRGHPEVDFNEILRQDPLRMLRLVRFICKYGWTAPLSVLKTVKANASRIQIISEERIRDELIKIMKIGQLAKAIKFFEATGLIKYIFPEIQALKGVKQNQKFHQEGDALRHTMMVLKNAKPGVESQLAALLHDTGKASTTQEIEGAIHSYGHEEVSGRIAEEILRRLKFDSDTIKKVKIMVENHMRPHALVSGGPTAIRKFIREVGDELVDSILDLAEADELGKIPQGAMIPGLREKVEEVRKYQAPVRQKAVLNGNEIMALLNIKPSAKLKEIQQFLLDLEDQYASNGKTLDKETAKVKVFEKYG